MITITNTSNIEDEKYNVILNIIIFDHNVAYLDLL